MYTIGRIKYVVKVQVKCIPPKLLLKSVIGRAVKWIILLHTMCSCQKGGIDKLKEQPGARGSKRCALSTWTAQNSKWLHTSAMSAGFAGPAAPGSQCRVCFSSVQA